VECEFHLCTNHGRGKGIQETFSHELNEFNEGVIR
jgi:hypothetical protein